ncbi:TasA family protein [Cellulosimicrobium cellulans]|uniref:TasA family protein n=1 Tax=Cellulosimicrobium cellulans TaxID=1710 RepID=UPI0016520F1F|nr:TasA family protein [Cellulosimicrobium cellulans]
MVQEGCGSGRSRGITGRARMLGAAGVVAVMAAVGSYALFSDSGTVSTTFTAGTLDLKFDADVDGAPEPYVVTFDGGDALAPGVSVTRDLVAYNSGSVPATLALGTPVVVNDDPGDEQLQDVMSVRISETTAGTLYDGPLTAAAFTGLELGSGGTAATGLTLTFVVTVDAGAGVGVAGQSVQVDLPFTAGQAST